MYTSGLCQYLHCRLGFRFACLAASKGKYYVYIWVKTEKLRYTSEVLILKKFITSVHQHRDVDMNNMNSKA